LAFASNAGVQAQITMAATRATVKNFAIPCFVNEIIGLAPFEKFLFHAGVLHKSS
jgi:hypothetical protein